MSVDMGNEKIFRSVSGCQTDRKSIGRTVGIGGMRIAQLGNSVQKGGVEFVITECRTWRIQRNGLLIAKCTYLFGNKETEQILAYL